MGRCIPEKKSGERNSTGIQSALVLSKSRNTRKRTASAPFVRNPDYHTVAFPTDGFPPEKAEWLKQFAGQKLPLIDEMELPILRETSSMWLLARLGYFDDTAVAKDSSGLIVTPNNDLSPDLKAKGMTLERDTELSTFFISFNCSDPILANPKLRKALSCAYNSQAYCDIFRNGVAPVADQLVPPGLSGHLKDWT